MSVPPVEWQDAPSTATPLSAALLNQQEAFVEEQATIATAAAVEAVAAAAAASLPTEAMVNAVLTDPLSDGRVTLDNVYQSKLVYNVKDYGATGDGVTDDTTAVETALIAAAGNVLNFPAGHYILTDNFTVPADTIITGAGMDVTTLDWSTKATWTYEPLTGFFTWEAGEITASSNVTVDVVSGDGSVTVADGSLFAVGDFVRVVSNEVLWSEAVQGEVHRIVQKATNLLYLSVGAFASYTIANGGRVEKLDMPTAGLHAMTIRGKGINPDSLVDDGIDANRGDNAAVFQYVRDLRISEVRFVGVENRCLRLNTVIGGSVRDCMFVFDPARVRLQYGVSINGASTLISVTGCHSWNDRHMVTTSTSGSLSPEYAAGWGIPRIISITGNTAHGSWQDPIDTHRGGEYITITGNALTTEATGVKARGTRLVIADNIITGKQTSPYDTVLAGVRIVLRCRDVQVTGNLIRNFADGVRLDQPEGAVLNIAVNNNTITGCVNGVSVNDTMNDISIAGNYITTAAAGYPIYINGNTTSLTIRNNTLVGGTQGIYATVTSLQAISTMLISGNFVRGSSNHAMFIRNVTNTLITGNMVIDVGGDAVRLSGTCTGVTVQGNMFPSESVGNLATSGGTTMMIGLNGPVAKPTGVAVTAAGVHAALVTLGIISA